MHSWDTSSATDMMDVFLWRLLQFNQILYWDVQCTGCRCLQIRFNQDYWNWDTSSVTDMRICLQMLLHSIKTYEDGILLMF